MKSRIPETRKKNTWFGITATVTIDNGFLHKAGFGAVLIPHPPVANQLLRLHLPQDLRRDLTFDHEFAHFQTVPVLFTYMLIMFIFAYVKSLTSVTTILFLLVASQAVWEILSEGLIVLKNFEMYRKSYDGVTKLPRIIFWGTGGVLTVAGWVLVMTG